MVITSRLLHRFGQTMITRSDKEVQDMFQEILARGNQPKETKIIADILPNASPLRLKRINFNLII